MSSKEKPIEDPNGEKAEEGPGPEEDLIEPFLSTYDRLQTRKSYGHDLRDFFDAEEVRIEAVLSVSEGQVENYLARTKEEKGESAAARRASALRSFYGWVSEEGLLSEKKAKQVKEATYEE